MRQTSAQGPSRLSRAPQLAVDPLLGHPALHLCPGSAPKIRYLAPRKSADFVHLQHSNQELLQQTAGDSPMRRDAEGCAAPLTATVLPVPPQKPKTVSRGGSGPAGRREREKNAAERDLNRRRSR